MPEVSEMVAVGVVAPKVLPKVRPAALMVYAPAMLAAPVVVMAFVTVVA